MNTTPQDSPPTQKPDHAVEAGRVDAESGKSNEERCQHGLHVNNPCDECDELRSDPATNVSGTEGSQGKGTVEERIIAEIRARRAKGLAKYGVGVERTDFTQAQWLQHAKEEALDLAIYLERLIASPQPQASGQLEQIALEAAGEIYSNRHLTGINRDAYNKEETAKFILTALSRAAAPVSPQASAETKGERDFEGMLAAAAHEIMVNTDAASRAAKGPRFCFEEYVDEVKAVLRKTFSVPIGEKELTSACRDLVAFVGVMFGKGPDAIIPETVQTPLGIPVKIGEIMRDVQAALSSVSPHDKKEATNEDNR